LIIDDSTEIAELVTVCLGAQDVQTEAAMDGHSGLALARSKRFDLALIDLGLPDMDGLDVCQAFKSDKDLKHVPFIIMTGRESTEDKVRAFELGAVDYLNKPFNFAEMQARVLAALRRKRTQDNQAEASHKERQQTLEELRRISKAVDSASDAIVILNPAGKVTYVNSSFTDLFGFKTEDFPTPQVQKQIFTKPDTWDFIWDICHAGDSWSGEVELRSRDQRQLPALCRANAILDEANQPVGAVLIFTDITQRKRLEQDLLYLANHDSLTGLYNRRCLSEFLTEAVAKARQGVISYLLYIDLDNFKVVNNAAGHPAGDRLLKEISEVLRVNTRETDRVARFGGDEFTILLNNVGSLKAITVARRLVRILDEYRFVDDGHTYSATVSIGIMNIDGTLTAEDVLTHAASACYLVKTHGRNGFEFFSGDNTEISQLSQEADWSLRTRDALRSDRMELWLQPIVPLKPGKGDTHFEALLRMRNVDGQLILPGVFMSAAEHFGNMQQIDQFVMHRAVSLLKEHPTLNISINLSAKTLNDSALPNFIESLLAKSGVAPARISFEVTETTMIQNLSQARNLLIRIKELGCRFALDDFGSGASSMTYLRDLPVDYLKIDGSFVKHLDTDPVCRALVKSMNEVAHILGKETVAEYVVNGGVLKVLQDLGIDYAQGWHICEPAPPAKFFGEGAVPVGLPAIIAE
jgi:diguanylate cyclase (GGDEF)-like protein/PAS domain S-box-containing protein